MTGKELARIRARWTTEHKISAQDVERLLDAAAQAIVEADAAETRAAADRLRRASDPMGGLLDDLFPRRP